MQENKNASIDLEEYAQNGKSIPEEGPYKIKIDKEKYVVDAPMMMGRQLLGLAGKNPPEQYAVFQRVKGGQTKKVELDETVDLRTPGIERFMTLPLDQTEG